MREYASLFREYALFASLDDKHKINVGEPSCPVAAAERGWQVLMHSLTSFQVGDHDFSRSSITPSVSFLVDIPSSITGSWYDGQVYVLFKDSVFEPSSSSCHAAELGSIPFDKVGESPILFLYTDGGPDHRLTYASVKLSLIALYRMLDLDYMCATRTAPHNSYRNPVERIMAVLNLGLQSVGLARSRQDDEEEAELLKCNSMAQLRESAKKNPSLKESQLDSVAPVKVTLSGVTVRLELKKKKFIVSTPASEHEICDVWSHLKEIDPAFDLGPTDKIKRVSLPPGIQAFLKHCCYERHYSFEIRKCGDMNCKLCKPPRLPPEIFKKLHSLPNPMPGDDGHYKPFGEVFGKETSEEHRPSLNKITSKRLPFYPSVQHVLNCNTMLMCDECGMWRLVYSTRKLKPGKIRRLKQSFDDVSFSCGADLQEADLPAQFKGLVYVKKNALQ